MKFWVTEGKLLNEGLIMNNQELREKIGQILYAVHEDNELEFHGERVYELMDIITQEKIQLIEALLTLLDELEMNQPEDLKRDNWRNWKYIRNSIVDKYLKNQL